MMSYLSVIKAKNAIRIPWEICPLLPRGNSGNITTYDALITE